MSSPRLLTDPNGLHFCSDSFDRFGDDLCELLLSYMDFEEKFRYECVSKQWRRLIFNKVTHFDHKLFWLKIYQGPNKVPHHLTKIKNYSEIDNRMKTVFQKCHNLRTMRLFINEKTVSWLSLLTDYCPRLKTITELEVTDKVSPEAFTACGQSVGFKVEELRISELPSETSLLQWCPNLKRLNCRYSNEWLCLVDNEFLPRLNTMSRVSVDSERIPAFIRLVDKYETTMKKIDVSYSHREKDKIYLVFQQLSRLKNLECLNFSIHSSFVINGESTPKVLTLSIDCPKLSKITLFMNNVYLGPPSKPMVNLKSLTIQCTVFSDHFFANISSLMPNLKELDLKFKYNYANKHLTELSRLKHLTRLALWPSGRNTHSLDDSALINLVDNCKAIKVLDLGFRPYINSVTINKLKGIAIKRLK